MKVTPLEIRQKTFEKVFRGFDKDEVNAFLLSLSQEWEKILDEQKELRIRLSSTEKEVEKLREVETSLFKTLKTAEDTGASLVDQANKTAELVLREAQIKADGLMSDAKSSARSMIEQAEHKARHITEALEDDVKNLEQTCRMLEVYKENLLGDLKNLSNDTLEKIERVKSQQKKFSVESQMEKLRSYSWEAVNDKKTEAEKPSQVAKRNQEDNSPSEEHETEEAKKSTSFFDQIE